MTPKSASTRTSTPHIETITCYLKVCVDQFFVKQVSLDFPIDIAGLPAPTQITLETLRTLLKFRWAISPYKTVV